MMRELFIRVVVMLRESSIGFKYLKLPAFQAMPFNLAQTPEMGKGNKSQHLFRTLAGASTAVHRKAISAPEALGFHPNAVPLSF
jgi:hypothetical protein